MTVRKMEGTCALDVITEMLKSPTLEPLCLWMSCRARRSMSSSLKPFYLDLLALHSKAIRTETMSDGKSCRLRVTDGPAGWSAESPYNPLLTNPLFSCLTTCACSMMHSRLQTPSSRRPAGNKLLAKDPSPTWGFERTSP